MTKADPQTSANSYLMPTVAPGKRARIFISYKRNCIPDEYVAQQMFQALRGQYDVFIDQRMLVGTRWAECIEAELRRSDFLITLLSYSSVLSEMVQGEIETAHRLSKENAGRPVILPVRLGYQQPFQYPLSAYLNPLNWATWERDEDTPHLIKELINAISGGELTSAAQRSGERQLKVENSPMLHQPLPSAQPIMIDMPEGTMDPESEFYVERPSDSIAMETIKRCGVTITIKGPRQMGKSSLLVRTINAANQADKQVVFLDFQLFDRAALKQSDLFFQQFCRWITDELGMEDRVDEFWERPLGNGQRATRYMEHYLLKELGRPLVLAMDEVESIFDTDFRTDFFSMLRSWHNSRATKKLWKNFDLVLATSTEPYQLIEDLNQSPFNVGQVIELFDFNLKQVADLNRRHGRPLSEAELQLLMNLLNGHPYLMRCALYLVAAKRLSLDELFAKATADHGPFGDHLRNQLFRLHDKKELVDGLKQILRQQTCHDERVFFRLRGAGLVRREKSVVIPRCQLYADYLREHLDV